MDTRKLLKGIAGTVIGLAFIALAGLTIFQHQQIKRLTTPPPDQVSQTSRSTDGLVATEPENTGRNAARSSKGQIAADGSALEELNYQLQATEEELDMVNEDLNKEMDRKTELARQRRELQKKQLKDPSLQKYMRQSIDKRIASFVKEFNISPEDAEAFAEILLAQQMSSQELFLEAQEIINPSEEDRARFSQLSREMNAEYETKAKDLLGEAVQQEYQPYQMKWYIEEYRVGEFSAVLGPDETLTDAQRTALVDALMEAQEARIEENADKIEEAKNTYVFPSENYDPEHIDEMVENMTHRNDDYIEAAQGILSLSQNEKLLTYLDQELDMMVSSMKMAALEYGYSYDMEDDSDAQE